MSGNSNFPTGLDDDSSLLDVTDGVSSLQAAHHNNLKEAIKAIESKVGIDFTADADTLDYRLGNATNGHRHDGASGQGPVINATAIEGLASYIAGATAGSGGGGFTPVGMIVERAAQYNAPASSVTFLQLASYYDPDWNAIPSIPTAMGLLRNASFGNFEALEAGVWALQGAVSLIPNMATLGDKVELRFTHPGAVDRIFRIPTINPTGLRDFFAERVFALATGGIFGIRVTNNATTVASGAAEYAAFDLIRLGNGLQE